MPNLKEVEKSTMKIEENGAVSMEELIKMAGVESTESEKKELETRANENIDIVQNSNWYNAFGVVSEIRDLSGKTGNILPYFSGGFLGSNLPKQFPVPYDIKNYFMKGRTPWVSSARPAFDAKQVDDQSVTLSQTGLILEMNITFDMLKYSTETGLRNYIVNKMKTAMTRTQESMIINGDIEAGATGNVNSDDQLPATTFAADGGAEYHATLLDHGIRENAINNSNTVDISAFDSDNIQDVVSALDERYQDFDEDILILANTTTYRKMLTDDSLKLALNTANPTIDGKKPQPFGFAFDKTSLVPKTEPDGKVSATPSNNIKGQFLSVFAPAVKHGFGQDVRLDTELVAGYGIHLVLTIDWSFVILDPANTCAAGINMTI